MDSNSLKNIRLANHLSQKEFADILCVGVRTIQKYESGSAIPEYMVKLINHEFSSDDDVFSSGVSEPPGEYGVSDDVRIAKKENEYLKRLNQLYEEKISYLENELSGCRQQLRNKTAI